MNFFLVNYFLVNYYLVTFGIVTDRRTDGKRRIRAHRALAQVGSKKEKQKENLKGRDLHLSNNESSIRRTLETTFFKLAFYF